MARGLAVAVAGLALAVGASGSTGSVAVSGWTTFGNGVGRNGVSSGPVRSPVHGLWLRRLPGRITSQPLVVRSAGVTRVYAATTAGVVQAFTETGRTLWRARVAAISHSCKQLDSYGVTGTPVVDRATHALYLVDGRGRLHALDLRTGKERAGWPVQVFSDFRQELVWGALTAVRGSVYLGTGSYCDTPMVGKVIRVDLRTRAVSQWEVVPAERGGGGGIWGWGGLAYSPQRESLLVATGNAFRGGSNDGDSFREWEPYGEHLVVLSLSLRLRAANHPAGLTADNDLDFAGSPVVVTRRGCPEQVVALNKNGTLYAWRTKTVAAGTAWTLQLAPSNPARPLITQAAYSTSLRALFVTTTTGLVKVAIGPGCTGRIAWRRKAGPVESTPTIAASTVWFVSWHGGAALIGIDGRTGRLVSRRSLGKDVFYVGPAVLGGRLYLGSFGGHVRALE